MKKFLAIIVGLLLLPLAVHATDFTEGKHYTVISATATEKPEVQEFFSYYCPHCFKFEPLMKELQSELDDGVQFKKNHVDFLGGIMGPQLTIAQAAAQLLNVESTVTSFTFNQLHTQKQAINGEEGILAIFEKAGIKREEAQATMASFTVKGMASQMKRATEKYKIHGVPSLIVNGKYKVKANSVKTTKEYVELVKFLTQKKD